MPLLYEELSRQILAACFEVSNELGAGFLESVYHRALIIALRQKGLKVDSEMPLTVTFRGQVVGQFSADLLVEDKIIIELKAVSTLAPEYSAQVINYLKGTGYEVAC
jgi:GxxExxY protein